MKRLTFEVDTEPYAKIRDEEIRGLRRFDDDDIKMLNISFAKEENLSDNFN